jgi:hypothetical protein
MNLSNENTLLWREEPDCLIEYASAVPNGGCIVEIGTAAGGTAKILAELVEGRAIEVHTVDIATTDKARGLLKDTAVKVVNASSPEFAKQWDRSKKVDLLFIDGDHTFKGIYEDFHSWFPTLSDKGKVLFHDVDPPRRGGVAHLAVQIFVDTLIREGMLLGAEQKYRFVYSAVARNVAGQVGISAFTRTLQDISDRTYKTIKKVFSEGVDAGVERLKAREDNLTSYQACCCFGYLLNNFYEDLLEAGDKNCIMRNAEMAWMLKHGFGKFISPYSMGEIDGLDDYMDVSHFIARLQVVLNIYRSIAQSVVAWEL